MLTGKTPARQARTGQQLSWQRSARGGGLPTQQRVLRARGRQTVRRLLAAGRAEFGERGFHAVRVDDVARAACTSHSTFYEYFASKEDLFQALLRDALHDLTVITGEFPVVTRNQAGRAALRRWVGRFCDTYAAHTAVIRVLSQAETVGDQAWSDGLRALFGLAETITTGMTAARPGGPGQHAELTALACVMMLERVNYMLSVGVSLPAQEIADQVSAIIYAAFHAPSAGHRSAREPVT